MNQKQTLIFAVILFAFIGFSILIFFLRKDNIKSEISASSPKEITNVHFYKDFLRDDSGLNAPIIDSVDCAEFLNIMKNITFWGGSIKSLDCHVSYKIRFNLNVKKNRLLTIDVFDTGDNGILSISQGEDLITPAGDYQSYELLQWIKKMEQKDGFENIRMLY